MAGKRFSKLNILGIAWRFIWDRHAIPGECDADDFGSTDDLERLTVINVEKCRTERNVESTVLHEIIHAVLGVTGQSEELGEKREEGLVLALENGLYPVICDLVRLGYFRPKKGA